ncbi:MAG TPA: 30S ribosome-binding factor RbfA [Caulobacteraceae bacterium]|nr:30S ribosome-binding factor RbfA [Caulobacteraceae bacterium]
MSTHSRRGGRGPVGPSQRQLRAGELVRHALADILRHETFTDPALQDAPVTVSEVRMSPDLKHAICFVEPLGGVRAPEVIEALNRSSKFLRGRLGHAIELKFTPDLKFVHDESFEVAARIDALLDDPRVRRDVQAGPDAGEPD